jgi:hypothetical protein
LPVNFSFGITPEFTSQFFNPIKSHPESANFEFLLLGPEGRINLCRC